MHAEEDFGFTFRMDEETRTRCALAQQNILKRAQDRLSRGGIGLLVLDEALDALNAAMLDGPSFRAFIEDSSGVEIVLTGRGPPDWLLDAASYVTEMRKVKHPFDRGIAARTGIER
jgi:cob(I)alamin adenosyltransferase